MGFDYEKVENEWFKPKKTVLDELEEYVKQNKIKEFEKTYGKRYGKTFAQAEIIVCNMILDKIQELKKELI